MGSCGSPCGCFAISVISGGRVMTVPLDVADSQAHPFENIKRIPAHN